MEKESEELIELWALAFSLEDVIADHKLNKKDKSIVEEYLKEVNSRIREIRGKYNDKMSK